MLVTLTSSTSGEIMMFAEIARHLFEIIGKERTARGVFTLEQLPAAIEKLRQAIEAEKGRTLAASPSVDKASDQESQSTPGLGLAQRAHVGLFGAGNWHL
jgi:hypothetical protein